MATTMEEANSDTPNSPVDSGITKRQTVAKAKELAEEANWFEANQDSKCLAVPLPDNAEILEAIRMLSEKQDETFRTVFAIKQTTESTSKQMEKLTSTVEQLTLEVNQQKQTVDSMKNVIQKLKAENKALKADIADCQRYSRRWSLKVHGIKEEEGEDIR